MRSTTNSACVSRRGTGMCNILMQRWRSFRIDLFCPTHGAGRVLTAFATFHGCAIMLLAEKGTAAAAEVLLNATSPPPLCWSAHHSHDQQRIAVLLELDAKGVVDRSK